MGAKVSCLTGMSVCVGDFDECGADVEGFGARGVATRSPPVMVAPEARASVEGVLHGVEGALVDEWADEGVGFAWVADVDGGVDLFELRDELVVDVVVDDEAAECGAALAGGAHGREGDGAESEVEVGGGGDDGGVVAAEFEDGSGEAGGESGATARPMAVVPVAETSGTSG